MVLVQEAFYCRLGSPSNVASEASPVAGPPEGIALAVLLGEDQQDLLREQLQGETALGSNVIAQVRLNLQLWRGALSGGMSSLQLKNYNR